jgi:hypothetical protein
MSTYKLDIRSPLEFMNEQISRLQNYHRHFRQAGQFGVGMNLMGSVRKVDAAFQSSSSWELLTTFIERIVSKHERTRIRFVRHVAECETCGSSAPSNFCSKGKKAREAYLKSENIKH